MNRGEQLVRHTLPRLCRLDARPHAKVQEQLAVRQWLANAILLHLSSLFGL